MQVAERKTPLAPGTRSSLRDVLTPPGDFELEHALGTAYSLDAATLIAIPLFADGSDESEQNTPLGVQRIFELGKRITLLVQGDRINVPAHVRPELLALVEEAVVICSQPNASFHPKLLVLEYRDPGSGAKHRRVVLSSRNLTVDTSWDFVVVLDEAASGGAKVPGLGEAIRQLERFVTSDEAARAECRRVGALLDSIRFEPLPSLENVGVRLFSPGDDATDAVLGTLTGDDLLVISPFVRPSFLKKLANQAGAGTRALVTRPVDVDDAIFDLYDVHQLREDLSDTPHVVELDEPIVAEGDVTGHSDRLRGLHAKMYFATNKTRTAIVLTSANASPSGWGRNVEIALFGEMPAKRLKVSDLLRKRTDLVDALEFGDLLVPLTRDATEKEADDPDWLKDARRSLASASAQGELTVIDGKRSLSVTIKLNPAAGTLPAIVAATAAPHAYPGVATPLNQDGGHELSCTIDLPPGAKVTRFLSVTLREAGESHTVVLLMGLVGERDWSAEDAKAQLMREMKPQFLRDLAWKVGVPQSDPPDSTSDRIPGSPNGAGTAVNPPILERLLANLYSPRATAYVETLDGLIGSVADDPEFAQLVQLWGLLKAVPR